MEFLISIVFLTNAFDMCRSVTWLEGLVSETRPGFTVEYVLYEDKVTWNEARSVCQEIGGDLAKIDSQTTLNRILETVDVTFDDDIFTQNYWVGLTEVTQGQQLWVSDCSSAMWSANYADVWESKKKCYTLEKTEHGGKMAECRNNNAFLCERYLDTPCSMEASPTVYSYSRTTLSNENACNVDCLQDLNCIAYLYTESNTCLKVVLNTNGGSLLNIAIKNCVVVTWNRTDLNPTTNGDCEPNISCGNSNSVTSTTSTSTSTTTSPATTTSCTCSSSPVKCPNMTSLAATTCPQPTTYYVNLTDTEILELAREMARNLTIDPKSTSAYFRRLHSAYDNRPSSSAIGVVGLVFVMVPLSVLVLIDLVRISRFFRHNVQTLMREWRTRILPDVVMVGNTEPGDVFGSHYYG